MPATNKLSAGQQYIITGHTRISTNTMLMRLGGDTEGFTRPGQFVNIAVPGFTLRRPISVCDLHRDELTIVYDIVGHGTEVLSKMNCGETLDIIPALGNGFDVEMCESRPLLVGGGVGCPPLYGLAKKFISRGISPVVVLGFNSAERAMMTDMFAELDVDLHIATVDGSMGTPGFVTDAIAGLEERPGYFYACGPMQMLRALCRELQCPGQVSLEARMGCGFGACMCCSLETKTGPKRICKEGPVFEKDTLIWK
ncbi:MAG: dihydroorotate dehydrogenase electron transfer subunit [Candidatus Amulumruptor caecigallinarius]|nr:dihydroorotate dehydrogenase electron transfer subunit [Candidatus Amulumruptor caecigallinarius]